VPRGSAPDDDPDFLKKLDADRAQTKRIRDLEDELNRFDDESGDSPDATTHDDPAPGSDTPDDGSGRRPPGAPSAS